MFDLNDGFGTDATQQWPSSSVILGPRPGTTRHHSHRPPRLPQPPPQSAPTEYRQDTDMIPTGIFLPSRRVNSDSPPSGVPCPNTPPRPPTATAARVRGTRC